MRETGCRLRVLVNTCKARRFRVTGLRHVTAFNAAECTFIFTKSISIIKINWPTAHWEVTAAHRQHHISVDKVLRVADIQEFLLTDFLLLLWIFSTRYSIKIPNVAILLRIRYVRSSNPKPNQPILWYFATLPQNLLSKFWDPSSNW